MIVTCLDEVCDYYFQILQKYNNVNDYKHPNLTFEQTKQQYTKYRNRTFMEKKATETRKNNLKL